MQLNTNNPTSYRFGEMQIYSEKFGRGTKHILAFHGYGLRCSAFYFLAEALDEDEFTLHIIGLFQHESSFPKDRIPGRPLQAKELKELIEDYSLKNGISDFSLFGYSIGGRICFQLLLLFPERITGIIVAAPDGIVKNRWYSILMKSKWLSRIYLYILQQTVVSRAVLGFLRRLRWLDEESLDIASAQVANKKRANRVYETWSVYRDIFPKPEDWMRVIHEQHIPSFFHFGKKDEIIGSEAVEKMEKLIREPARIVMLDEGHMLLKKQFALEYYVEELKGMKLRTIT